MADKENNIVNFNRSSPYTSKVDEVSETLTFLFDNARKNHIKSKTLDQAVQVMKLALEYDLKSRSQK